MRVKLVEPEHMFVWPLGNTIPENEKVKIVCRIPDPVKLSELRAAYAEPVTNEMTNTTRIEKRHENVTGVYDYCVLRVEGVQDESGSEVKPDRAKEKFHFYVKANFGLDDDIHGCFQNEFDAWFNRKILRIREDAKKNATNSPPPSTDTTGSQETGKVPPTS